MIRLAQLPAPPSIVSVQMSGYMSSHKPVKRTVTADEHTVRTTLREEYRQHLLRMVQSFADACEVNADERAERHAQLLADVMRDNLRADHMQMARAFTEATRTIHIGCETPQGTTWFTRQAERDEHGTFLAAMLPKGDGYADAYALMIDLTNTLEAYLTDPSSLWVMGEWQQLPDADGNSVTMRPWEQQRNAA